MPPLLTRLHRLCHRFSAAGIVVDGVELEMEMLTKLSSPARLAHSTHYLHPGRPTSISPDSPPNATSPQLSKIEIRYADDYGHS